jgi:hypothetical protein
MAVRELLAEQVFRHLGHEPSFPVASSFAPQSLGFTGIMH